MSQRRGEYKILRYYAKYLVKIFDLKYQSYIIKYLFMCLLFELLLNDSYNTWYLANTETVFGPYRNGIWSVPKRFLARTKTVFAKYHVFYDVF